VNAHGIENGRPESFYSELASGVLKDYKFKDVDNPEKIYFRAMYMRDWQVTRHNPRGVFISRCSDPDRLIPMICRYGV
jgi:hypothetical protein